MSFVSLIGLLSGYCLESAISDHEFLHVNHILMTDDGSLLPCTNKSELIHGLEGCVQQECDPNADIAMNNRHLVIDARAVVQAIMHSRKLNSCNQHMQYRLLTD